MATNYTKATYNPATKSYSTSTSPISEFIGPVKPSGYDSRVAGGSTERYSTTYMPKLSTASQNTYDPSDDYRGVVQEQGDAEIDALNDAYDRQASELKSQLKYADQQRMSGLAELDRGLGEFQGNVARQKTRAEEDRTNRISDAASYAREVERRSKNQLRGLGILNSTAAGELLQRPQLEFGKQRADISQQVTDRVMELDDYLNEKNKEVLLRKSDLEQRYAQLVDNIQRDMRFGTRDKANAIRQAQAGLSSRMLELAENVRLNQQAVEEEKQKLLYSSQHLADSYDDPEVDFNALGESGQIAGGSTSSQPTFGIDPYRRRQYSVIEDPINRLSRVVR